MGVKKNLLSGHQIKDPKDTGSFPSGIRAKVKSDLHLFTFSGVPNLILSTLVLGSFFLFISSGNLAFPLMFY